MKKTVYSMVINAPINSVFEVVDSEEHLKKWMAGFVDNIHEENFDYENPVGKKFKQRLKEGGKIQEYEGEVLSYNRPKELGIRLKHSSFQVDVYYYFTSVETNQTRLDYECKVEMYSSIAKVMGFLFSWFTKRILTKQLNDLKAYAEKRFDGEY